MGMVDYKWDDPVEKEKVERGLITTSLVPDADAFKKILSGDNVFDKDARYMVWMAPAQYAFDSEGKEGVEGPLEAIQGAVDLHLDGGWDWLVWDRVQQVGFSIDSNSYIYAPLEKWAEKYYGIESLPKKSTEYLQSVRKTVEAILEDRVRRGTL